MPNEKSPIFGRSSEPPPEGWFTSPQLPKGIRIFQRVLLSILALGWVFSIGYFVAITFVMHR
ncbi:hypothetical protein [Mycobacterium sp. 1245111.1]|uniref:hypothetical protein n=1 Tax=Mycobacterium sp. 1245111.1 TaxID=1834073 RepID=UPI000A6ABFBB|nr:hypothetical protein [Mycobacterium sp. 1245111.1]